MEKMSIRKFVGKLVIQRILKSFKGNFYFKLYLGSILLKIALVLKLDRLIKLEQYSKIL